MNRFLLPLLGLLTALTASAQNQAPLTRTLNQYLEVQHQNMGFSGVVHIANEQGTLYHQAIGKASHEFDLPLELHSKFKIASMTKSFTGMLLTLAEQEGKVALDHKLSQYFPQLPAGHWQDITLRHLLSHTAGLPHWSGFADYWAIKSRLALTQEQILADIFRMDLTQPPGTDYGYSSPAYYLLAVILEQVYALPYDELLQTKILDPLQMTATGGYRDQAIYPHMASGYHLLAQDSLIAAPPRSMATLLGGGHLYSTTTDMTSWCRSFLGDTVWADSIIAQTFQPLSVHTAPQKDYALYGRGWYLSPGTPELPEAYHLGGGTFGFSSTAALYPAENISVVVLANVSTLPMDQIRKDLEKIIFGLPFQMPQAHTEFTTLSSEQLHLVAGEYQAENGMTLKVFEHNAALYAKLGPNPPLALQAIDHRTFVATRLGIQFTFIPNAQNEIQTLKTEGRGRTDIFERQ